MFVIWTGKLLSKGNQLKTTLSRIINTSKELKFSNVSRMLSKDRKNYKYKLGNEYFLFFFYILLSCDGHLYKENGLIYKENWREIKYRKQISTISKRPNKKKTFNYYFP